MGLKPKFETLAIKSVEHDYSETKPVSSPIYLSSTYMRNEDGSFAQDFIYARNDNPNRQILEKSIATLENGNHAFAFSSGMAAISAVFQSLQTGDHVLLPDDIYYAIKKLMNKVLSRWKLNFDTVDMADLNAVPKAIKPNTKLIWIETPSNPLLKITDISAIVNLVANKDILVAADNTWATPVLQNPLDLGADIVMHSSTKYFGGHSDVLGGCIVVNDAVLAEKIKDIQLLSGAVPSPFDCWLIARGIQTLHLRLTRQSANAQALATYLDTHPKIERVHYPGLISHPNHAVVLKQQNGFGAMLSVRINGSEVASNQVANALVYFKKATSLGGVESLVEHRRSVEGDASNTPDNLLRISVGIEHPDDLINDWKQALKVLD